MKKLPYFLIFTLLVGLVLTGCQTEPVPETEAVYPSAAPAAQPEEVPAALDPTVLVTPGGKQYTVSTALLTDTTITVKKSVTVALDSTEYADFNKLHLGYTADGPLRCTMRYTEKNSVTEDVFFLEAGTWEFCALISTYAQNGTASALTDITFAPLDSHKATVHLEIHEIDTETVSNFLDSSGILYLENERYQVGVHLLWGGGICYIEDKACPLSGVKNLINQADTGRLIQQSWYGTNAPERYADATFNNGHWCYNPVQGGDKYNNPSRILDVQVTENSISIKAQPQDWALNGMITSSYMENTYTLDGDVIRVDNRFVDFTGWKHPVTTQELPAFYVISYLDTFAWYDGAAPWTGDTLSSRNGLHFWGDPAYQEECSFSLKYSNTETWCAWIQGAKNYGIGLYVPGTDRYYAGRYAYNGSKDPKNGATNYVAPLDLLQIVSFEPLEYSYLMTAGSLEEIRETFTSHKDFTDNPVLTAKKQSLRLPDAPWNPRLVDFTDPGWLPVLTNPYNTTVSYASAEKAALLSADVGYDVQTFLNFNHAETVLTAEECAKIVLEYKVPADNSKSSYTCEFFLCAGDNQNPEGGKSVRGTYICDGEYHVMELPLSDLEFWKGEIHKVRFDYFDDCADGDRLFVRSIAFVE